MKIVYVVESMSGIGGLEHILAEKINYLAGNPHHEVILLLLWKDTAPIAYPLAPQVQVVRLDVGRGKGPFCKLEALRRYNAAIKSLAPDLTIYTWVMGAFLAAFSSWQGKSLYESHLSMQNMQHAWLLRRMMRKVDCVVTLTQGDATHFSRARRVCVIPNFTHYAPDATPDYQSRHCISFGRFVYQKNFPRLIQIWERIHNIHPDWMLDIIGEGPEEKSMRAEIARLQLQESVILHPAVSDLTPHLLNSSIYLMSSRFEGLPLALIEAFASSLPAVAFDCDYGPRDIIEEGKNGFLIPTDNGMRMVEKVCQLIDDPQLRRQFGEAARNTAQRYRPDAVMLQWEKLFEELTQQS